jgi:hypothetical protein
MKVQNALAAAAMLLVSTAASAAEKTVSIAKCPMPIGTVAIVDGDTQGWTKFGLGSPRELIAGMIAESNCFTLHNPASGAPADFLISAIAGDKEVVDQGVNMAKAAVTEGALRTGMLGAASGVPIAGAALRLFGGFGGKKKTVAAGLRVISPATGQTLAAGSGEAKKTTLSWGGVGAGAYGTSKDGKLLTSAFATAYNAIVAQAGALTATGPAASTHAQ